MGRIVGCGCGYSPIPFRKARQSRLQKALAPCAAPQNHLNVGFWPRLTNSCGAALANTVRTALQPVGAAQTARMTETISQRLERRYGPNLCQAAILVKSAI